MALSGEMVTYLLAAAADRRANPRDDIISELGAAEVDGDRLTDDELGMFLVQLLVAGNETTRNMMSGGLVGLAQTPGEWEALATRVASGTPRALGLVVEEMLRWTTPVVAFMRTTTRPVDLGGRHLGAGEPVLMLYASANRDEAVFGPSADRFDGAVTPTPTWPSGSVPTSVSVRSWPGSKGGSCWRSSWPGSARSNRPARWSEAHRRSSPACGRRRWSSGRPDRTLPTLRPFRSFRSVHVHCP